MMTWLNFGLAMLITLLAVSMIDRINGNTHCSIRWAVVLMAVGGLMKAIGDVWDWEVWSDTVLRGGVAMYLLANMRSPLSAPSTSWGRRGAYAVGVVTVLAVILAWGIAP